jgi:hypothetical protein
MPSGIAGNVNRPEVATVESTILDQTYTPAAFGVPVKTVSGKTRPVATGDAISVVKGFLVRPYPTSGNGTDGLGTSAPNKALPADVLRRGYISALLKQGTAAKDAPVYVRLVTASTKIAGDIEGASDITATGGTITGTGTGTIAFTAAEGAVAGTYSLVLQSTSQTAKVTVIDPNGDRLADATVGTAYTAQGITFTITAAGTMTSGDSFAPTVVYNTAALPDAYFTGAADTAGNVEIAYNI